MDQPGLVADYGMASVGTHDHVGIELLIIDLDADDAAPLHDQVGDIHARNELSASFGCLLCEPGIELGSMGAKADGVLEAFNSDDERPASEVPAVTGACLAITSDLFDKLGGFDTEFVNGYEDVDLALRARQAGWRCFYEPASVIEHALSQSAGRFDHA